MKHHFENIIFLYGDRASIRLPNGVFRLLSSNTKHASKTGFCYSYLVVVGLLYKYAHYVDYNKETYIQNSDIKELLGYNRTTKSVDYMIKKGGLLDELGLTETTKDYPIDFIYDISEDIDGVKIVEFVTISDRKDDLAKTIVKNRNYTVKEPLYLTTGVGDNEYGTLYSFENTHQITIEELFMLMNGVIDNTDMLVYSYLKSMCKGMKKNRSRISLETIEGDTGLPASTFFDHLKNLKKLKLIDVNHKGWRCQNYESNDYIWIGVDKLSEQVISS